jgi:hypothetical protein
MFEDEKGLYLENLSTGEAYRFALEKVEMAIKIYYILSEKLFD